jgi:uncharacterized ParB-like nuclease family protein
MQAGAMGARAVGRARATTMANKKGKRRRARVKNEWINGGGEGTPISFMTLPIHGRDLDHTFGGCQQ